MMRKKVLLLLVGVATTTLMGVVVRVRAVKPPFQDINPESSQSSDQKQVMGKKTAPKNQAAKPKTTTSPAPSTAPKLASNVVWREDFSTYPGSSLNPAYWNVAGANQPIYNDELQKYNESPSNVRIEGGNLVLEARIGASGYVSGMVDTKGKIKITQGSRIDARIKLPKGRGTWPAFWLLSDNQPYTTALNPTNADWESDRFYMHDGEIDIMESYGMYPGVVEATVHTFAQTYEQQLSLSDGEFHNYWLEWTSGKLVMGVDDRVLSTYQADVSPLKWPYTANNQMYIILNLAMGGTGGGQIIPAANDDWKMLISSINYSRL